MTEPLRFRERSPGDPRSPGDLLRECGQKLTDPELWKEFQKQFHKTIFMFVLRSMGHGFQNDRLAEACDLTQDVYLRLIANNGRLLSSFKGDADFSVRAFLARVAVNVVFDHYRATQAEKRKAAEVISIEEARETGREIPGEAFEMDIASILSWVDVQRLVESDSDRRNAARNVLIFKLHYVDHLSVNDISKFPAFGFSESTIHRVLRTMTEHLKKRIEKR